MAKQPNDHNDKQEEVGYKRSEVGHYGGLDVERRALVTDILPCHAALTDLMTT
jgi:hypothetical protein